MGWNSKDIFNRVRDVSCVNLTQIQTVSFFMQKLTRGKTYIFISKGLVQQLISPNFDE